MQNELNAHRDYAVGGNADGDADVVGTVIAGVAVGAHVLLGEFVDEFAAAFFGHGRGAAHLDVAVRSILGVDQDRYARVALDVEVLATADGGREQDVVPIGLAPHDRQLRPAIRIDRADNCEVGGVEESFLCICEFSSHNRERYRFRWLHARADRWARIPAGDMRLAASGGLPGRSCRMNPDRREQRVGAAIPGPAAKFRGWTRFLRLRGRPLDHETADMGTTPALKLDNLTKKFGSVTAVRDLSLQIEPGSVVAFLGPNGAGKTTTLDMILGFSQPTSGEVEVLGKSPKAAIARGEVSAVMQTGGLLKDYTVAETIQLISTVCPSPRPIPEVLQRAGLTQIAERKVGKCSGGEQQRLRFALALLNDPDLILLDEPTTGMDVEGRREFWAAMREDTERGRTVMFATHYLDEADAYADRIVLIRQGQIVADGTTAEIKNLASGRIVRANLEHPDEAALRALPGVDSVEVRGQTVLVHTKDSDPVARYLLNETAARDLEISAHNLEEAFLQLTADDDEENQS